MPGPITILSTLFILLMIIVIAGTCSSWLGFRYPQKPGSKGLYYEAAPAFLSAAERSFFGVLKQAVEPDHYVFAKVRLADLVRPAKGPSRSAWQSAFNRICGKHVDFVICEAGGLNVVAVVELDDSSHRRLDRGLRDGLVDSALADAGIPVLRVPARHSYSISDLRQQFQRIRLAAQAEVVAAAA